MTADEAPLTISPQVVEFANPNLVCASCRQSVRGWEAGGDGVLVPCRHAGDIVSLCPTWGPVDGCRCDGHPHHDGRSLGEAS